MKAYHNSVVLRNDGEDPSTLKLDLNAGITKPVTVRINNTQGIAPIFDVDDNVIANPLSTDDNGNYAFKAADNVYDIIVSEGTANEIKLEKVEISEFIPATSISVKPFENLSLAVNSIDASLIFDGSSLNLSGRNSGNDGGGALWSVVLSSSVTENTYNIIQCVGIATLSLVLIQNETEDPRRWGAIFDNATDIGPTLNFMLSNGVVPSIPKDLAVINTQVDILGDSNIIFNGSRLRTTSTTLSMFSAVSVDDWSVTGSAWLTGTAPGASTTQKLFSATGCKNYIVENLIAYRSQGHGFFIGTDGVIDQRGEHGTFNNCRALENRTGWEFEDGTSAEYTILTGCSALANVTGVLNGAGNTNWNGGNIVDNTIGISLYGGSNDNHGIFSGVNINHNTQDNVIALDVGNGYTFDGCHLYANGAIGSGTGKITLTNCKQFNFNGGTLASPVIINKGGNTLHGTNMFRNMYVNVESWTNFTGDGLGEAVSKGLYGDSGLLSQFTIVPLPTRVTGGVGFKNSWVDAAGLMPLNYYVDEDNVVHITGSAGGGTTTFATVLVSLGAAFAPPQTMEFILKEGAAGTNAPAYVQVDTTGDILWLSGANVEVCFNISYPLNT